MRVNETSSLSIINRSFRSQTRTLIGFEALVRWRHPEFGLVPPKDFIPVAEETGQILTIGQTVLESACRQAREWQKTYPASPPLFVSVNLSVKQFNQPGLVENIASLLEEFKLPPRCLKLEITESVFSDNIEAAVGSVDATARSRRAVEHR